MSHEQYQKCIEECIRCMMACNNCYNACLDEENVAMMTKCIRLDRQCADICALRMQCQRTVFMRVRFVVSVPMFVKNVAQNVKCMM